MPIKISVAQFQIHIGEYERNYNKAESLIHQARELKSRLILLPELWLGGYDYRHFDFYLTETLKYLVQLDLLAKSLNIAIAGTFPIRHNGEIFNSLILFDPSSSNGHYEKIHLFSLMQEDRYFNPGTEIVTIDTPFGKIGLTICYDLRFPELFRRLALSGAKLVLVSAEWPISRIDHWKTLLCARAIENQVFMIGGNAVGKSARTEMGGASAIIDPWGRTLTAAGTDSEELITAELDLDEIPKARESITVFRDRRPEIYG